VTWQEDGLTLGIDVSTSGDFVKLGTTTTYPFVAGGSGYPAGWSQYLSNGGIAGDVSWNTAYGRFSIGNIGTDIHNQKKYGIYRDFPTTAGKKYLIQGQCRTTAGRTTCIRYVSWAAGQTMPFDNSQVWSYPDWEDISIYTDVINATYLRVWLYAAPYTQSTIHAPADANWGIQWQNFALVEMEASYPDPIFKTVTCDVHSLVTHYGRDRFLNRYDVGTASIELLNDDGEWNYKSAIDWGLRPGRFVRIVAAVTGVGSWTAYYGIIDSITNGFTLDGHSVARLECVDVSSLLSNYNVATFGDEGSIYISGTRFRNLALSAGWNSSKISNDPGQFNQQAILANGRTVRDELGLIADSEGGGFYCSRGGVLTFRDRTWDQAYTEPHVVQIDFTATSEADYAPPIDTFPTDANAPIVELSSIATEWSRDRVINEVSVANQGGTAVVTTDYVSQTKYGPRTYQRLDFLNDNTHPEYLDQRTNDIMTGYVDAILRVNEVGFRPRKPDFPKVLALWLNYAVRVRYEHPTERWGFAVVSHVQGLTHSWTTKDWHVVLTLDQPESFVSYVVTSENGWDDGTWDETLWDEFGEQGAFWDSGELWADGTTISPVANWED
jgi:hypothetical protein